MPGGDPQQQSLDAQFIDQFGDRVMVAVIGRDTQPHKIADLRRLCPGWHRIVPGDRWPECGSGDACAPVFKKIGAAQSGFL